MAAIPLRAYNREIENLIDSNQFEEAIAHCRHILQTIPKHIATYRLMGKAYLESQRYSDGADIFQRVLSSIPDDFVSHAGMSIIREDEGNLDAAIWHMERAFEAQPYNTAIQDELRRLYGRRDGIEPPKVRLTRGALARMYAKGDLHQQAVAELRAALADDPQRPDLQVLLARTYFLAGYRVEAVEACSALLKKLPFCLDANLILAAILPETERAADTQIYQQRAYSLDPYLMHAPPRTINSDAAPEQTITVEKLVWKVGQEAPHQVSKPGWATSLGLTIEEKSQEAAPDWMSPEAEEPQPFAGSKAPATFTWESSIEQEAEAGAASLTSEEAIPDWMKGAGWTPASGAAKEETSFLEPEQEAPVPDEGLARAEIPDWLKGLAPPETTAEAQPDIEAGDLAEAAPWLQKSPPGSSDTIVNWLGKQKTPESPAVPAAGETPDWLQPSAEEAVAPSEELPDWLKGMEAPPTSTPLPASPIEQPMAAPMPSDALPDWLTEPESENVAPSAATPDWLPELNGETRLEAAPVEALPDWLKEMGSEPAEAAPSASWEAPEEAAPAEAMPEWLKKIEGEPGAELPAEPEMEIPAADIAEAPAGPTDAMPDWLKEIGGEPAAELTVESAIEAPVAEITEAQAAPPDTMPDLSNEAAALAWLESLAVKQGAPEEELLTKPEDRPTVPPDWLQETPLSTETAETPAAMMAELPAAPAEAMPDWLKDIEAEAPVEQPAEIPAAEMAEMPIEAAPAEAMPDWLKEIAAEAPTEQPSEVSAAEMAEMPIEAAPAKAMPDWLKEIAAEVPGEQPEIPAAEMAPMPVEAAPAEAMTNLTDEAAAMAWLESLAAKQGVPEEELLTKPEERPTEPPVWVQEMPDVAEITGIPAAELVEAPAAPAEEAMPDWLKEIAAEAPVEQPAEIPAIEMAEMPVEAAPAEAMPDWLKEIATEVPSEQLAEIPATEIAETPVEAAPAEAIPDWLKEIATEVPSEQLAEIPAAEIAETPAEAAPAEAMPDLTDEAAAMAWLESLAAKQGVPEEELLSKPEERPAEPPAWVHVTPAVAEITEIPAAEFAEAPAAPAEEAMPDWLKEIAAETPVEQPAEIPAIGIAEMPVEAAPAEAMPDWLKEIEAEVKPEMESPQPVSESTPEAMPDWLKEEAEFPEEALAAPPSGPAPAKVTEPFPPQPETTPVEEEIPAWLTEAISEPLTPEEEVLPLQKVDINKATLAELEGLPGIGFSLAQNILLYRESFGIFQKLDDLQNVSGIGPAIIDMIREFAFVETTVEAPPTSVPSYPPDSDQAILAQARGSMSNGDITQSTLAYARLMQKGSHLEEIILDLQDTLYRYPVDITIWQTLGDAYLRNNQLQDALDAYTKAEELLR